MPGKSAFAKSALRSPLGTGLRLRGWHRIWNMGSLAVVAIAVLHFGANAAQADVSLLRADPDNEKQVVLGALVYREHCASCHGVALEGEPNWRKHKASGRRPAPPHDATGHSWHHPDEHLFRVTKFGFAPLMPAGSKSDMNGFAEIITDDQIWAVIAFIKSKWTSRAREVQRRIDEAQRQ